MEILIVVISVLVITGLAWLANRFLPFQICPICAGVSLTWLLLLIGVLTNQLLIANYQLLITMLMGGTVVGIAFQGEKRFRWAAESIFRFKVPVVIIGFLLVYWAVNNISWLGLGIEVIVLGILIYLFFIQSGRVEQFSQGESPKVRELEEKMKDCC